MTNASCAMKRLKKCQGRQTQHSKKEADQSPKKEDERKRKDRERERERERQTKVKSAYMTLR